MIVCQCVGVSDGDILEMIEEGAAGVADIMRRSGAGRCCEPCRAEIASIVRQSAAPAARREAAAPAAAVDAPRLGSADQSG